VARVSTRVIPLAGVRTPNPLRHALLRRRNERAIEERTLVAVRRMPVWKSSLLALAGLVFVLGIALGEMTGVGQLLHALNPARHFDIFFALHQQLVVGSLIGVSLLWLLPPHPWAKRVVEATDREEPAEIAGEAGDGGPAKVTVLSLFKGRGPPPRQDTSMGVGG